MSGLLWFVAGFVSCLLVSLLSVAFVVWRTPPARDPPKEESPATSPASTRPTAPVISIRRGQADKSGR
jgi:hypothetical protein